MKDSTVFNNGERKSMHYSISVKNCVLSDETKKSIEQHVSKLSNTLSFAQRHIAQLAIILRRHKKRRYNSLREYVGASHAFDEVICVQKTKSPVYFNGTLKLILPIKSLTVTFSADSIDETINTGFKKITKEFATYKEKHFSSNSQYSNHRSFRTDEDAWQKEA